MLYYNRVESEISNNYSVIHEDSNAFFLNYNVLLTNEDEEIEKEDGPAIIRSYLEQTYMLQECLGTPIFVLDGSGAQMVVK